jgi:hypothetical protein
MKYPRLLFALLILAAFAACNKSNTLPKDRPYIDFISLTPDRVQQSVLSKDTVFLQFSFKDGNANLGVTPGGQERDIYVLDLRDSSMFAEQYFPNMSGTIKDPTVGMQGTCTTWFPAAYIPVRQGHLNADTLQFEVYIKDRAGRESNHIITTPLYLYR